MKNISCLLLLAMSFCSLKAQKPITPQVIITGSFSAQDSSHKILVQSIEITGTKKTKPYIVLREIQFKKGDSLNVATLQSELEKTRQQVYNTTLFDEVKIDGVIDEGNNLSVHIQLKERWYIYPVPQLQLVDRNFNVWWKTYRRSFDRVNYGIKFVNYNLSGRKDQLRIYLINGYSRNILFSYSNPYSNKKLTAGFSIAGGYSQNREVAYKSSFNNNLLFYPIKLPGVRTPTRDFVRNTWYLSGSYLIRRGLFKRHSIFASYTHLSGDAIVKPPALYGYLNTERITKSLLDVGYTFSYSNLDNNSYPLKGLSYYAGILKRGIEWKGNANMLSFDAGINKYMSFQKNWFLGLQAVGKLRLPFDQPYQNQRGLGYNETYLRGLEYYVIDGVAYGLLRTTLKKKVAAFNVAFPYFPRLLTRIPFSVYAKAYGDLGYSYNKKQYYSYLNNRMLYTGGLGIDLVTLYDVTFRFEYSFNQLREIGFFFHTQNGF